MQKVKDGEVHKVKVDVTREVIGGIRVGAVKTTVFMTDLAEFQECQLSVQ